MPGIEYSTASIVKLSAKRRSSFMKKENELSKTANFEMQKSVILYL